MTELTLPDGVTLAELVIGRLKEVKPVKSIPTVKPVPVIRFPISNQRGCVICKSIRLDPDPTGVTCGSEKCLAQVGEKLEKADDVETERDNLRLSYRDLINQILVIGRLCGIENTEPLAEKSEIPDDEDLEKITEEITKQLTVILKAVHIAP